MPSIHPALPFSVPDPVVKPDPLLAIVTPVVTPREPPTNVPTSYLPLPLAISNAAHASVPQQKHVSISPPTSPKPKRTSAAGTRLNKFVRRLHDMLQAEQSSGIVEWRRGLLVLHSTDAFAKNILPRYFNTKNFKTFRRQLNYYGFVHVRSFSTTGSTTTALWVNRELAQQGDASISSVLMLKRVEPCESAKTAEGRRVRKELAVSTVEDDIGVNTKSLQLDHIRSMALRGESGEDTLTETSSSSDSAEPRIPLIVHCHSVNGTTRTTIEGFSSIQGTTRWPHLQGRGGFQKYETSSSLDESFDEDNTSAANLLLTLSKSSLDCM